MEDKVQCKGCGSMVWAEAKMIDGYCHDCYTRGRHLPPDEEDWLSPVYTLKQAKPETVPTKLYRASARKRIKWLILAVLIAVVAVGGYLINGLWGDNQGETSEMESLRNYSALDFINNGIPIPNDALDGKIATLAAFMDSGADYRITGLCNYSTGYIHKTNTRIELEMTYNSAHDVYKFILRNTDSRAVTTITMDGTFYIVNENGKPYVLVDTGDAKLVIDPEGDDNTFGEGLGAYEFLMGFAMENIIETDFIRDSETIRRSLNDEDFYIREYTYENTENSAFNGYRHELRTYQDKPVYYYYCDVQNPSSPYDMEFEGIINFYYDNIPQDAPSVADYQ